MEQGQLLR